MPPVKMPAWELTAGAVWNSFRSSGKRHLFLTGSRNSGKSTLLQKLGSEPLPGVITRAVPGQGVYLREKGSNEEVPIGIFEPSSSGESHRMHPAAEGFSGLGVRALRRCGESESPWVMIDEIGFLEASCPEYCTALEGLLRKKQVIAAIRKRDIPFLTELLNREDAFVLDMDAPFGNGGCVIMASGLGTRFGGNKLLADFQGKPLIAGALAATEGISCRVVVTRHRAVAEYCRRSGIAVILHDLPHRSDTVRLGLEAMADADYCIFCQGDQPLLRRDTVASMAMLAAQKDASILRAGTRERFGAPTVFPKGFFEALKTLPQGKGGNFIAKKYPEQVRFVPVQDLRELADVDTPEDLAQLVGQ